MTKAAVCCLWAGVERVQSWVVTEEARPAYHGLAAVGQRVLDLGEAGVVLWGGGCRQREEARQTWELLAALVRAQAS